MNIHTDTHKGGRWGEGEQRKTSMLYSLIIMLMINIKTTSNYRR